MSSTTKAWEKRARKCAVYTTNLDRLAKAVPNQSLQTPVHPIRIATARQETRVTPVEPAPRNTRPRSLLLGDARLALTITARGRGSHENQAQMLMRKCRNRARAVKPHIVNRNAYFNASYSEIGLSRSCTLDSKHDGVLFSKDAVEILNLTPSGLPRTNGNPGGTAAFCWEA
ncbi:hypothetical protein BDV59DRAFT_133066 [Aspergillus ambiguus]|uniref:uncharacterized protein n=1 Tax=Aspergillus ambiguus TaxID=176160 RepID=UPI003CCD50E9